MASGSYRQLQTGQALSQVTGEEFEKEEAGSACTWFQAQREGGTCISLHFVPNVGKSVPLSPVLWTRDGGMWLLWLFLVTSLSDSCPQEGV